MYEGNLDEYCDRKSFNNKCMVTFNNGVYTLYSYCQKICSIKNNGNTYLHYYEKISNTTARHIHAFMNMLNDVEGLDFKWKGTKEFIKEFK